MHLYKRQKRLIIDGENTLILNRDRRKGGASIKLTKSINNGNKFITLKDFYIVGIGKGTFREKVRALQAIARFMFWKEFCF